MKYRTLFSEEKRSSNCRLLNWLREWKRLKLRSKDNILDLTQGLYKHINANHCWNQAANDMALSSCKSIQGS